MKKKIEIRKVDPKDFYKDKRVTKFIKILNQVKINMMEYSAVTKKNIWQNYMDKILSIMGLTYTFSTNNILENNEFGSHDEN